MDLLQTEIDEIKSTCKAHPGMRTFSPEVVAYTELSIQRDLNHLESERGRLDGKKKRRRQTKREGERHRLREIDKRGGERQGCSDTSRRSRSHSSNL